MLTWAFAGAPVGTPFEPEAAGHSSVGEASSPQPLLRQAARAVRQSEIVRLGLTVEHETRETAGRARSVGLTPVALGPATIAGDLVGREDSYPIGADGVIVVGIPVARIVLLGGGRVERLHFHDTIMNDREARVVDARGITETTT